MKMVKRKKKFSARRQKKFRPNFYKKKNNSKVNRKKTTNIPVFSDHPFMYDLRNTY